MKKVNSKKGQEPILKFLLTFAHTINKWAGPILDIEGMGVFFEEHFSKKGILFAHTP